MTIQETCQRLCKSESTIRRMIKAGRLIAHKKDGVYDISNESVNDLSNDKQVVDNDKTNKQIDNALITQLKLENESLRKQVDQQQAIIMQLSRNQQLMIESSEQKKRRSWLSKLFRKATDTAN